MTWFNSVGEAVVDLWLAYHTVRVSEDNKKRDPGEVFDEIFEGK